jgi:hypothetical protein
MRKDEYLKDLKGLEDLEGLGTRRLGHGYTRTAFRGYGGGYPERGLDSRIIRRINPELGNG